MRGIPKRDLVHNETRLGRGRVRCMRRGTASLSKWHGLVAAIDEARTIRMSSSREHGARQEEELGREGGKGDSAQGTRVDESGLRRGVPGKREMLINIVAAGRAQGGTPRGGTRSFAR